jgi:DNA (cytosine-5)-methyltransferase 1
MNLYNEHDPKKAAWLRQLIRDGEIPAGDVDERSITTLSPDDLDGYTQCHFFAGIGGWSVALALAGWPETTPVWTGSCPCQSLSLAGHRKAHADKRHLWPAFHALIEVCKPSDIFGEQVANGDGYEWLAGVRADLEGSGYAVGAADLCAAGVGSPQIRQRIYWGAHAAGLDGRAHGLLVSRGVGRTPLADRGFPRVFGDGRWTPDTHGRGERLPSIVRSYHGLSAILCGFGDAIVPALAAKFVRASLGVTETANTLLGHTESHEKT